MKCDAGARNADYRHGYKQYPVNGKGVIDPHADLFIAISEPLEVESNALVTLHRYGWAI
jgi:hypothetical protein